MKVIKMKELFKNKKRMLLSGVTGVLILIVAAVSLTNPFASAKSPNPNDGSESNASKAALLMQFKSKYVGDNSNTGNLIGKLPYAAYLKGGMSMQTEKTPYGITVNYDFSQANNTVDSKVTIDLNQVEATLRHNAVVIFALIDNVDVVDIYADLGTQNIKVRYDRSELQQSFPQDLRDYTKNQDELQILLNSSKLKLLVYPQKYALTMSSTPGIRLLLQYDGTADQVQYSADSGKILNWDSPDGKVTEKGTTAEFPVGIPAYWSPLDSINQFGTKNQSEIPIRISVMQNETRIAEKQVVIHFDGSTAFFTVEPSSDVIITAKLQSPSKNLNTIEEAVGEAVKNQGKSYLAGEVATEGHLILDTEEKNGQIQVYTIASFGYFGFENGIFTTVSGSGAIPTVITFSKDESGGFVLLQYQEPQDGSYYLKSIKKMFPQKLWKEVLAEGKHYPNLAIQKEAQATAYLQSIGREATVSADHVEKKLVDINVEASNKLFAELTKYNTFLNTCPYWIGSKETIENGVRYLCETSQSKTDDGYDLVTFQKKKEEGSIVEEYKYKIVGSEPQLLSE